MVPEQTGQVEEEGAHEKGPGQAGSQRPSAELQRRADSAGGAAQKRAREAAQEADEGAREAAEKIGGQGENDLN